VDHYGSSPGYREQIYYVEKLRKTQLYYFTSTSSTSNLCLPIKSKFLEVPVIITFVLNDLVIVL